MGELPYYWARTIPTTFEAAHAMMILLRLIHVLSAIFWAGTLLFMSFYLFPTLAEAGPAAGPIMTGLRKRGMLVVLPVSALLTLLSGGALLGKLGGGNMGAYMQTRPGQTFSIAGGLAIVAFLLGIIVSRPLGEKMMKLTPEMAAMPEGPARAALQLQIAALQRRLATMTMVVAVLVIFAAAGMAVARYV